MRSRLLLIPGLLVFLASLSLGCSDEGGLSEDAADGGEVSDVDDGDASESDTVDTGEDTSEVRDGGDATDTAELPDADAVDVEDSVDDGRDVSEDAADVADVGDATGEDAVDADVADTSEEPDTSDATEDGADGSGDSGLSEGEQLLLNAHNETRTGSLTPPPSPELAELTWDADLATVAQAHAEECKWTHNGSRSADYANVGGSGYVGENISAEWGNETVNLSSMYDGWAEEAAFYNYSENTCQSGEQCGHYTQIVWRETQRVGCGWTQCPTLQGIDGVTGVWFLVCNYAPGGNINGRRPY